jgi:hypothetical protein
MLFDRPVEGAALKVIKGKSVDQGDRKPIGVRTPLSTLVC